MTNQTEVKKDASYTEQRKTLNINKAKAVKIPETKKAVKISEANSIKEKQPKILIAKNESDKEFKARLELCHTEGKLTSIKNADKFIGVQHNFKPSNGKPAGKRASILTWFDSNIDEIKTKTEQGIYQVTLKTMSHNNHDNASGAFIPVVNNLLKKNSLKVKATAYGAFKVGDYDMLRGFNLTKID